MTTQSSKVLRDRMLSPYELRQRGHSERVVKLLTEPPSQEESVLDRQSRDMAKFLFAQGFGPAILDTLSEPKVLTDMLTTLLGSSR